MVHKCKTDKDYRWEIVAGCFLSTYSPEVADYVRIRQPKTTIEMANQVQQYFDGRRYQPQYRSRSFEYRSRSFECGNNSGHCWDRECTEPQANGERQSEQNAGKSPLVTIGVQGIREMLNRNMVERERKRMVVCDHPCVSIVAREATRGLTARVEWQG